jgi:DNA-binding XRE family transcriptional regulator
MSAADLAERINCDTTTIYRYESEKMKPDPDTMYMICDALGDVDKWTTWMRTEYPQSYGRVHPETVEFSLTGALMSMYAEIADVIELQKDVMHDGADGSISNIELAKNIGKEVTDVIMSAQRVKSLIEQEVKTKEAANKG